MRNGTKVTLYLAPETRDIGNRIAKSRYRTSLSNLIEQLVAAEAKREARRKAP